jgi:predicted ATPase
MTKTRLSSIRIQGYKAFRDLTANFSTLEVIVGSNGSGKTSLFEFLKFLRDGVKSELPTEIVSGTIGQEIFHVNGEPRFWWSAEVDKGKEIPLRYQGEVLGPIGQTKVVFETVKTAKPQKGYKEPFELMKVTNQKVRFWDPLFKQNDFGELTLKRSSQLALSTVIERYPVLYDLREYIESWRFYSAFNLRNDKIRQAVPTEQEPQLNEDASNLSAVLFYLMTEAPNSFDSLQRMLKLVVPGFRRITVKARGGPGYVIAFWEETGLNREISLADLSDGVLRLLCWSILCVHPNPPGLIGIDEPEQGLHPRVLPTLASAFLSASRRTQFIISTHSSYFLSQFPLKHIAIMKKHAGEAIYIKPAQIEWLQENLQDFDNRALELEFMHRSDELENLLPNPRT